MVMIFPGKSNIYCFVFTSDSGRPSGEIIPVTEKDVIREYYPIRGN